MAELTGPLGLLVAAALLLLTFVQVVFGGLQFREARRDRIEAEEALEKAEAALVEAEKALIAAGQVEELLERQRKMAEEINATFADMFGDICRAFEGSFVLNEMLCVLPNGAHLVYRSKPIDLDPE